MSASGFRPAVIAARSLARPVCAAVAIVLACLVGPAWAQNSTGPARVSVFVFEHGRPVEGLTVRLGETTGRTDADGAWRVELPPQSDRLTLFDTATPLLALPVRLRPGEIAQYIVTLAGPDRKARVSIESSYDDGLQPPEVSPESAPEAPGEGVLAGRVVSTESGKPVAGARIFVSGTPVEARTDDDGSYRVEVPSGQYAVSVLHSEYATRTVEGVAVVRDGETRRDFELPPAGLELAEYVVVQPYIEGSLTSVVAERRESAAVTDVLSAEQISRAGDSDAAGALKRVTGLTLVDGQYIYVRGLGERYSSVLLNGASIPSPDPTRRVVPLDLFPTDVIESVAVQKTADATMPGAFGGGTVQLRTVGYPESFTAKFGVSGGYTDGTTGEDGLAYDGGARDWTGHDDGSRAMPESLAEATADGQFLSRRSPVNPDGFTLEELEVFGEDLATGGYNVYPETVRPDFGLTGAIGNSFDIGEDVRVGFISAVRYSNSRDHRLEERNAYVSSDAGLSLNDELDVQRSLHNIDFSAFTNIGGEIGGHSRVGLNTMLLRQTEDEVSLSEGLVDSQRLQRYRLEWTENELFATQFYGEHALPVIDLGIDWRITDAAAGREDPNTREYRRDDDDGDGEYIFSRRPDSNSQSFADLEDDLGEWAVDLHQPFPAIGPLTVSLDAGISDLDRDREASLRTFSFSGQIPSAIAEQDQESVLSPENIGPGGVLRLQESTQPTDNYTAMQRLRAYYGALDLSLFERLRLYAGVRREENFQEVITENLNNPQAPPVISNIDEADNLKSAALTWAYSEPAQIRLGYAETVSRPDFRELSPAPFLDPVLDIITVGNPDLEVTRIKNYDARWEYYFDSTDSISVAAFYKEFANPIEKTFSSGGSTKIIVLRNALAAEVEGWEIDLYKSLGFIDKANWLDRLGMSWMRGLEWENYYVAANYADIESTVELDTSVTTQTNANRPLQGQSPYVVNLQVGYNSPDEKTEWTLLFNQFGERIVQAGVARQPDIYEQPFRQLDFVYKRRFLDRWRFTFKLNNLLDPAVEFTQGDEITRHYKKGRELSLGLQVSF